MPANIMELRLPGCLESDLVRCRYFNRQLISAADLIADQDYFREKLKRHNRILHGWGSVCGLEVVADPTPEMPWRIRIESGFALDPFGNEIYAAEPTMMDLAQCGSETTTDPCDPAVLRSPSSTTDVQQVFIAVMYAECLTRPVRAMPAGCACDEAACEYSRIRDGFQFACLTELPASHQPPAMPTLCDVVQGQTLPVCLPCPSDPWVVLARINLPASSTSEVTTAMIDNSLRRQILSTAVLQEQLIRCCCQGADLAVAISVGDTATIAEGARIPFEITLTNNGPSSARNIVLTSTIDSEAGPLFGVDSANTSHGEWTEATLPQPTNNAQFRAEIAELLAQATATLEITVAVRGTHQSLRHTVDVQSDTPDPNIANNSAFVSFPRTPPVGPGGGPGVIVNPS